MNTVRCYDPAGKAVSVALETVTFCPAVYGIFIENNQVLLLRHPQTNLLFPPGHILQSHEIPTQAIRHDFRQITDMMLALGPLLFVEDQYRLDENGRAWHLSALYYALSRLGVTLNTTSNTQTEFQAEWLLLSQLKREEMFFGYEAIQAGQLRLK